MNHGFVTHSEGASINEIRTINISARTIAYVALPVLLLLILTKLVTVGTDVTVRQLMQDPTTTMRAPFYIGALSNIGVLFWATAASVSLFAATLAGGRRTGGWPRFLLLAGLLTAALLLDDFFLIHDEIMPQYLGIAGEALGAVYLLLMGVLLWVYRGLVRRSDLGLLALALGGFALSGGVDVTHRLWEALFTPGDILLVEDGAKLLGIAAWMAYLISVSASILRPASQRH